MSPVVAADLAFFMPFMDFFLHKEFHKNVC